MSNKIIIFFHMLAFIVFFAMCNCHKQD